MASEARLEKFWIQIMKYSQILMKKYAERSEAKKITEKFKEGLKSSILGPQTLYPLVIFVYVWFTQNSWCWERYTINFVPHFTFF